jgi:hypothetical protein
VLLVAVTSADRDDKFLQLLATAKDEFQSGLDTVSPLSTVLNMTNGKDNAMFDEVGYGTIFFFSSIFGDLMLEQYLKRSSGDIKKTSILYEMDNIKKLFKDKHLDIAGLTMSQQISSSVVSQAARNGYNNKIGLDFIQGLRNVDKELTVMLLNAILPTKYDNVEHVRQKRAIAWACGLVKMAAATGMGEGQLSEVIANRVPERWQASVQRVLKSGGAKKLIQFAAFMCQFQGVLGGGGGGGGSSGMFSADKSALMKVFEKAFLQFEVEFEHFIAFAEWQEGALRAAFDATPQTLLELQKLINRGPL